MKKLLSLLMLVCLLVTIPAIPAAAKTTRTVIDNYQLGYTGQWWHLRNLDASGIKGYYLNTASYTTGEGTAFDYTFADCTKIYWYANFNPVYAIVDIYIDDKLIQTLDCGTLGYASTPELVWESPELPSGQHCLRVIRSNDERNEGRYFEIDRLEAECGTTEKSIVNDTTASFFNFVSGFTLQDDEKALGGTLHTATEDASWAILSFAGNCIELYGSTYPGGGLAEIYIGGEKMGTVDFDKPQADRALLFKAEGMDDSFHMLTVKQIRAGKISIDYALTQHPYNAATEIFRLGQEALKQMEDGTKTAIPTEEWIPVEKGAEYPVTGVKLESGIYADAFNKNVRMIKKSAGLTNYVYVESVWTDNFPSANEGRVLAGAGNSLRWIQDEQLDNAVRTLLDKATERCKESGYCLPEPEEWYDGLFLSSENPYVSVDECKNYGRVMYTQGLLGAALAGYEDAYTLMRGLYDWLNDCDYKKYLLPGSLGIQGILGATLCYGTKVGKPQDIITNMLYYEMDWYLDYLGDAMPEAMYMYPLDRPHAYMATAACAFLDMYGATGEKTYLEAGLGAWTIFKEYYVTNGGAVCMCEGSEYKPGNYNLSHSSRSVYETCNNVLWADLNHRLLQFFPNEEKYAYYLEQSLINIVFASQNANGEIRYFNRMTEKKESASIVNTCCEVQASRQLAQLPQFIYSLNDKKSELYINLFAQSSIDFSFEGAVGTLKTETGFPYSEGVSVSMNMTTPGRLSLFVRVPDWCSRSVDIMVNGQKAATGAPGTYVQLDRSFADGDIITFGLPMQFSAVKYTGNSQVEGKVRYGLMYGPVLMAVSGPSDPECVQVGGEKIANLQMTPSQLFKELTEAEKLNFSVKINDTRYRIKPYTAVAEGENFTCFPVMLNEGGSIYADIHAVSTPEPTPRPTSSTAEPAETQSISQDTPFPWLWTGIGGAIILAAALIAVIITIKRRAKT